MKMIELLDYEKSVLLDLHEKNSLLVYGEGLGIDALTYCLIKLHSDPNNLVLMCNHSVNEAKFYVKKLKDENEEHLPEIITAEISQKQREAIYKRGGVVFVSSRILVVDLLMERTPVKLISGVVVLRAHQLQDTFQDAFVIRLIKEKNNDIFVKAITDKPTMINRGAMSAESLMNQLGIHKLVLWPRFRAEVIENFKDRCPVVEEVKVPMSADMADCQACILELIQGTLRELASLNPIFKNEEFTLESALSHSFDKVVSCLTLIILLQVNMYLDPYWHELNSNMRQHLGDLSSLRRLLYRLIDSNPLVFLRHFEQLRQDQITGRDMLGKKNCSTWVLMSHADKLLISARKRVYRDGKKDGNMQIEQSLKLAAIEEKLVSILRSGPVDKTRPPCVLILANHLSTCGLVEKYLLGGRKMVDDWLTQPDLEDNPIEALEGSVVLDAHSEMSKNVQLHPGLISVSLGDQWFQQANVNIKSNELSVYLRSPPAGCGEDGAPPTLDAGGMDPSGRLFHVLWHLRPTHVITWEPQLGWVRQLEEYCARLTLAFEVPRVLPPIDVSFMLYEHSVEEQRYLTTLRREKEAFEHLIKLSATFVIQKDLPVHTNFYEEYEASQNTSISVSNRQQPNVLVDMREFRSELPCLLYKKGLQVSPITLTIADYIISPHICVERKSINDLIGSLNSGRLYQQCKAMSRHYANPIVLIEFPTSERLTFRSNQKAASFTLFTGKHSLKNVTGPLPTKHLMSRLVMLAIHFSMVRFVWCPSPTCTADLFAEMKLGRPEPTIDKIPTDSSDHYDDDNADPVNMLLRLPGVNWHNYRQVMSKVDSLVDLTRQSQAQLADILESQKNAALLWEFLHKPQHISPAEASTDAMGATAAKRTKFHLAGRVKRRERGGKASTITCAAGPTLDRFTVPKKP